VGYFFTQQFLSAQVSLIQSILSKNRPAKSQPRRLTVNLPGRSIRKIYMRGNNSSAACWGFIILGFATLGTAAAQTPPARLEPGPSHDQTNSVAPVLEQMPAVSGVNGKLDYAGGNMNSAEGNNFSGSISLPVTHHFGFQADALYSRISDLNFYGGAGHLFWRNPNTGLLGLAGGYLYRDGFDRVDTFHVGAEGEFYWRQFTFGFFGGLGSLNYQYAAPFIDTNPTRFVGRVSADYYPLENLRVGASFTSAFCNNMGKGEIEYQTPLRGLALTGEVAVGDHGYDHWLVGLRYYFGGKKTLRDRQRQDDPRSLMPQILDSLGTYGAEYNRDMNAFIASHSASGSSGGGGYGSVITIITVGGGGYGSVIYTPVGSGGFGSYSGWQLIITPVGGGYSSVNAPFQIVPWSPPTPASGTP